MIPYQTKEKKLSGTNYQKVMKRARQEFRSIKIKTKRRPYIRSAYFNKEKIFFDYFWSHLSQKPPKERFKRLQYFKAAVELIQYSNIQPTVKPNANRPKEMVYRFAGTTKDKKQFFVQIKDNKGKKFFMSCFPKRKNFPPKWGA